MRRAVGAGRQATGDEAADHLARAVERQEQGRAEAGLADEMLDRAFGGEAVVVAQLVQPQHAAAEHRGERAVPERVASLRREAGRVVPRVQHGTVRHVLGEHGEGPPIVGQTGDDQPVVRNEPLELRGELAEELPGIEGIVHRPPDGGQARDEVGEHGARVGGGAHRLTISLPAGRIDFAMWRVTVFTDHQPLVSVPMEASLFRRLSEIHGRTEIHDVYIPPWVTMFTVFVQMTPRWDGQARDVLLGVLSSPYLHPKIAIAVDEDVNIYDPRELFWAISTRVNPERDVITIPHERIHPLDISAPNVDRSEVTVMRVGGKMAIDATKPPLWRKKERDEFARIKPKGADDPALRALLARLAAMA